MTKYEWSKEGLEQALREMFEETSEINLDSFDLVENSIDVVEPEKSTSTKKFETINGNKYEVKHQTTPRAWVLEKRNPFLTKIPFLKIIILKKV